MHTAARRARLRPVTIFALTLTLGSLIPLAAFGQDAGAAEKKSAEQEIQELVVDLETRRADLEELTEKVSKNLDRAAAVMMEKELSERRSRYRRDVQHLVELVSAGEDAGAAVAQGRATATELLEADKRAMREKMEEVDREILELVDTADKGSPEEAEKARSKLVDAIPYVRTTDQLPGREHRPTRAARARRRSRHGISPETSPNPLGRDRRPFAACKERNRRHRRTPRLE